MSLAWRPSPDRRAWHADPWLVTRVGGHRYDLWRAGELVETGYDLRVLLSRAEWLEEKGRELVRSPG